MRRPSSILSPHPLAGLWCVLLLTVFAWGATPLPAIDSLRSLPPVPPAEGASVAWLGEWIFSDARLSSTGRISCASCHDPEKSFIDGLAHSTGEHRTPVGRNAPTLFGLRELDQFVDPLSGIFRQVILHQGSINDSQLDLEGAEQNTIFIDHNPPSLPELIQLSEGEPPLPSPPPVESNSPGNPISPLEENDVQRSFQTLTSDPINLGAINVNGFGAGSKAVISLAERCLSPLGNAVEMGSDIDQTLEVYRSRVDAGPLFDQVFGGPGGMTRERVGLALAAFLQTLAPPAEAPYAKHLAGVPDALDEAATRGLSLFEGKGACAQCHSGGDLRDGLVHSIRTVHSKRPSPFASQNGQIRVRQTLRTNDNIIVGGSFGGSGYGGLPVNITATPTLWDVARTAPYFGDGSMKTLDQALAFHLREMADLQKQNAATIEALKASERRLAEQADRELAENGELETPLVGEPLISRLNVFVFPSQVPVELRPEGELTGSAALESLVFPESLNEAEVADLLAFLRALSPPEAPALGEGVETAAR